MSKRYKFQRNPRMPKRLSGPSRRITVTVTPHVYAELERMLATGYYGRTLTGVVSQGVDAWVLRFIEWSRSVNVKRHLGRKP